GYSDVVPANSKSMRKRLRGYSKIRTFHLILLIYLNNGIILDRKIVLRNNEKRRGLSCQKKF
ncbi:hypothetical protein, partial [Paenibacillus larvae]|uniref:hypothetical protein n=1 Tax=Paenibacillus larvae TaxID=1464 RepID=UPI001ED8F727